MSLEMLICVDFRQWIPHRGQVLSESIRARLRMSPSYLHLPMWFWYLLVLWPLFRNLSLLLVWWCPQ